MKEETHAFVSSGRVDGFIEFPLSRLLSPLRDDDLRTDISGLLRRGRQAAGRGGQLWRTAAHRSLLGYRVYVL